MNKSAEELKFVIQLKRSKWRYIRSITGRLFKINSVTEIDSTLSFYCLWICATSSEYNETNPIPGEYYFAGSGRLFSDIKEDLVWMVE